MTEILYRLSCAPPHISVRPSTEPTSPHQRCVWARSVCSPSTAERRPTTATSPCCSCPTSWSSSGWSTSAWPWSSAPWPARSLATTGPRGSLRTSRHVPSSPPSVGLSGQVRTGRRSSQSLNTQICQTERPVGHNVLSPSSDRPQVSHRLFGIWSSNSFCGPAPADHTGIPGAETKRYTSTHTHIGAVPSLLP